MSADAELVLRGFFNLTDPERQEVIDEINKYQKADLRVKGAIVDASRSEAASCWGLSVHCARVAVGVKQADPPKVSRWTQDCLAVPGTPYLILRS